MAHPLASVQASLAAASRTAWSSVEADLRARPPVIHAPGARLLFVGLDPTRQSGRDLGRAIFLRHKDERFYIPLDAELGRRIAHLRELQLLFGWPVAREAAWNVVAEIVETRPIEPLDPPDPDAPVREHDLRLHEIYVPDQVLLVPPPSRGRADEGRIEDATPGLDAALGELDRVQGPAPVTAGATPEQIVKLLPQILATHHWRAFLALCDDSLGAADKRMAFEQFRQAYDVAAGALGFEGYDEGDPTAAVDGAQVRTRVRRGGPKPGEVLVRPIRWVKRSDGWRYLGGIL